MTRRHEAGFSLIELIVALAIASVIAVLLFGGYSFSTRAWNRASAGADNAQEIYAAQSFLRRAFTGISLEFDKAKFTGNASAMAFVSLFALPGEDPEPTEFGLTLDQCPEGQCLMLILSRPEWMSRGKERPIVRTPLIRGIAGLSIAYRERGADRAWTQDWPLDAGAPALVRIDAALAGKPARRWPTLYLAPPGAK